LGALLAVVVLVLAALIGALLANFNALLNYVRSVGRVAGDEGGCEPTDIGTIAVGADAGHHHLDVFFAEAGVGAVFASGYATGQGVKERAVVSRRVFHRRKGLAGVALVAGPTLLFTRGGPSKAV
jgi:hypothetical protein